MAAPPQLKFQALSLPCWVWLVCHSFSGTKALQLLSIRRFKVGTRPFAILGVGFAIRCCPLCRLSLERMGFPLHGRWPFPSFATCRRPSEHFANAFLGFSARAGCSSCLLLCFGFGWGDKSQNSSFDLYYIVLPYAVISHYRPSDATSKTTDPMLPRNPPSRTALDTKKAETSCRACGLHLPRLVGLVACKSPSFEVSYFRV